MRLHCRTVRGAALQPRPPGAVATLRCYAYTQPTSDREHSALLPRRPTVTHVVSRKGGREFAPFVACWACNGQGSVLTDDGATRRCKVCRGARKVRWLEARDAERARRSRARRILSVVAAMLGEDCRFGYEMRRSGPNSVVLVLWVDAEDFSARWRETRPDADEVLGRFRG